MIGFIPKCGECVFFQNEDINGIGYCILRCDSMRCGDQCVLDHTKMKPEAIAKALHYIQKWRRGAEMPMPKPYVIGRVLDAAIYQLCKMK